MGYILRSSSFAWAAARCKWLDKGGVRSRLFQPLFRCRGDVIRKFPLHHGADEDQSREHQDIGFRFGNRGCYHNNLVMIVDPKSILP